MMFNYKHYIRVNSNNEVIAAFSNAFEQPLENDILIAETGERHFSIQLQDRGIWKYTWNGETMIEKPQEDIDAILKPKQDALQKLMRLEQLDKVVPRALEDALAIIEELTGKKPHENVQKAIAEKQLLRST